MKRAAILICVCVAIATLQAQAPHVANLAVDAGMFPQVTVQFDVLSGEHEFVENFPVNSVTVVEGTQTVQGVVAAAPAEGTAYSVVIDTSLSMKDVMPAVREALAAFVDRLGPKDRVALVGVAEKATNEVGLTADRASVSGALRKLEPTGRLTNLYYAVWLSLNAFPPGGSPQRRVLVLVSDGRDEVNSYSQEDCVKEAAARGVNIVALGVATGPDGIKYLPGLQKLAWLSGGIYVPVDDPQSWAARVELVQRYINARRIFTWTSTLPGDGRIHDAVLTITAGPAPVSQTLHVQTQVPEAAPVKWWRIAWLGLPVWAWLVIAAALLLAVSASIWLVMRRSKRNVQALEAQIEQERTQRTGLESTMQVRLDEVQQQLKDTAEMAEARASQSATGASNPSPGAPPAASTFDKRRTVFQSGTVPAPPPGPGASYARGAIRFLRGPLAGSTLPLLEGRTTIGREFDNNIVLDDPKVSGHHATVTRRDGVFWIEDLNSSNGTWFMDGTRLTTPTPLGHRQQIKAGDVIMEFQGEA